MMKKLPNKPSALIRVAVHDLMLVMEDKRYKIGMNNWHGSNGKCEVCLAGSVMAKSLNIPISEITYPDYFNEEIENKLYAINCFRMGWINVGLNHLDIEKEGLDEEVFMSEFKGNGKKFINDMIRLADYFQMNGL